MARSPFREVWLSQDVLDAGDRADLSLVIDILQLMHVIRLVNYPIALLKMDQLIGRASCRSSLGSRGAATGSFRLIGSRCV